MLLIIFFLAVPLFAQDMWKVSIATMAAANAADAVSSHGRLELNPVLANQGVYSDARGAAVKAGLMLGTVYLERWLIRKHPKAARPLTILNFALAGGTGYVAARNFSSR